MSEETVETRVTALEKAVQDQVTVRDLEALQAALSGQILQLGVEMRVGFSALHDEIHAGDGETRRVLREEIRAGDEETRRLLDVRTAELRQEIRAGDEETRGVIEQRTAEILAIIGAADAETRRHAQMLHEEVIAQIKTIRKG